MIVLDAVFSPDDGGWYAKEIDLDKNKSRVSKRIYPTEADLRRSLMLGSVKWEKWDR
jgi:hypothetical protein